MKDSFFITLPSAFADFSIVWQQTEDGPKVYRIFLSNKAISSAEQVRTAFAESTQQSHPAIVELGKKIQSSLEGEIISFELDLIALEICSEFQQRVILAEYGIPRGWVSTYGRITRHLGVENGARAVGTALAKNPFPIVIPCHRAVRSDGGLGGYQGGLDMKRDLLKIEGVEVSGKGKVFNPKIYY